MSGEFKWRAPQYVQYHGFLWGYVYLMQCGPLVKVGTSRDPEQRRIALTKCTVTRRWLRAKPRRLKADDLQLIGAWEFDGRFVYPVERWLHKMLGSVRAGYTNTCTEWYRCDPSMVMDLIPLARERERWLSLRNDGPLPALPGLRDYSAPDEIFREMRKRRLVLVRRTDKIAPITVDACAA